MADYLANTQRRLAAKRAELEGESDVRCAKRLKLDDGTERVEMHLKFVRSVSHRLNFTYVPIFSVIRNVTQ